MASPIDMNTFNALKNSTGADFIGELIGAFLEDAPDSINQMQTALANSDVDSFRRAAHSLKSNAATFGAMELSTLAKELEVMGRENNLNIGNRLQIVEESFRQVESQLKALK
jgi:HPt (histidine-containing phosphotransfer) domain-containing protein